MSAIGYSKRGSGGGPTPLFEDFRRMKARVAPVGAIRFGPVGRDPAGPAKLPKSREPYRLNRTRRDSELDLPLELVADVKKNDIGDRLAMLSGWQIGDIFVNRF